MRLATFNIESLDMPPKAAVEVEARAALLRPALERLDADVLCLQEVNGQRVQGERERRLIALDRLLEGTNYARYHRAVSSGLDGRGPADVHNLVTLSRLPIKAFRDVRHNLVPPVQLALQTAEPAHAARAARFQRPLLVCEIDVGKGRTLHVVNLHLRAPLAASIVGQKLAPFVWKSVGGWAEGYFLAATQRAAQALELRLLVDSLITAEPKAFIAVAGDFNAEDHETAMKIACGVEEETGNAMLAGQSLVVLDRAVSADRRWSVLHYGRPQMLDHILASRALMAHFRSIEVHNETLGDEAIGYAKGVKPLGSYHAGVVVELAL